MKNMSDVNRFIALCGGYTKTYKMDFTKLIPKLFKFQPDEQKREVLYKELEKELEERFHDAVEE